MILILSSADDTTTHDVCKWLKQRDAEYVVLTAQDSLEVEEISSDSLVFRMNRTGQRIDLDKVDSYWYRRGDFNFDSSFNTNDEKLKEFVEGNLEMDATMIRFFAHSSLESKRGLSGFKNSNVNKLEVLRLAQDVGLNVPEYVYTGSKPVLAKFKETHGHLIFKTVSPGTYDSFEGFRVTALTRRLKDEVFLELPENFGRTFFQKEIAKKYEIRSYFLNEKFYSIAILSQESSETLVDYRNYDLAKPNRCVPYSLGSGEEQALKKLFQSLGLDNGSADLIYSSDGRLYFLEINPIGQFGNVSFHRNDFLEREIAQTLVGQ